MHGPPPHHFPHNSGSAGSSNRTVLVRAGLCLAVIVCGLALRRYGFELGLPGIVVKYGGSALWGTMVFLLVALAAPALPWQFVAPIAFAIAVAVELFRLFHTPWLDAFRLTIAGALLLGRIFSGWDILAYAAGIALGVLLDWLTSRTVSGALHAS